MGFAILIGCLLVVTALAVRKNLKWSVPEDSCNKEKEKNEVFINKTMYYAFLFLGIFGIIVGIIGIL